jgi:hypothetical protein
MAPPVRNILGQVKSRFDPRFTMDHRRILIANLSKGLLGEDKANLLGALLVSQFQSAAMARADVPEAQRRDFYLYIDEFHNFATDAFATILSEARKYRLALTLSHQYVAQVPDEVRDAVFGNVGSMVCFRVGETDSAVLSRQIGGGYSPSYLADLSNYEVCAKLLSGGAHGDPFLAKTYPPIGRGDRSRGQNVVRRSRERFAAPRRVVEEKIRRWMRAE